MAGKLPKLVAEGLSFHESQEDLLNANVGDFNGDIKSPLREPLQFSPEATTVFDAGRELWKYYHNTVGAGFIRPNPNTPNTFTGNMNASPTYNPNASLYDIREHFQGRNEAGKMNNKSQDPEYTKLIANLRDKLKLLALKIQPKVYEYEFLRK